MKEHKVHGALTLIIFQSVKEQLGENGLNLLLRRAGLEQFIETPPPDDETPTLEMSKLEEAIKLIIELFGEKAARPLLLRWGALIFQYSVETRPAMFGLAGVVTKFMREEKKIRFILKRVLRETDDLFGVPHILTENEDWFQIEIQDCYYCGGLKSANCICWAPVGFYGSLMKWLTGKEHMVREVECRAQGGESCKFIISKKAKGEEISETNKT